MIKYPSPGGIRNLETQSHEIKEVNLFSQLWSALARDYYYKFLNYSVNNIEAGNRRGLETTKLKSFILLVENEVRMSMKSLIHDHTARQV